MYGVVYICIDLFVVISNANEFVFSCVILIQYEFQFVLFLISKHGVAMVWESAHANPAVYASQVVSLLDTTPVYHVLSCTRQ